MDNLTVRQGETLPLLWENDEAGADTATLTISDDSGVVLAITTTFEDLQADLTVSAEQTEALGIGLFDYMITLIYEDGTVEKYPDVSGCNECELPQLEVCDANDIEEAS